MPKVAYDLIHPEKRTTSVVFASPHSGRDYPWSFLRRTQLDRQAIRSSEDAFVDQLFDSAPQFGAPFLRAMMCSRETSFVNIVSGGGKSWVLRKMIL